MSAKEFISICFTFVFGLVFGVYIFFAGWFDVARDNGVPTQAEAQQFSIVADVYGGCRSACPSFQILADGSYRYLFTAVAGEDQILRDGSLPRSLRRELQQAVTEPALILQSEELQPSVCSSFTDGVDVQYRITLKGTEYQLDTCGTTINTESDLWRTLVKIWNYFETGEA